MGLLVKCISKRNPVFGLTITCNSVRSYNQRKESRATFAFQPSSKFKRYSTNVYTHQTTIPSDSTTEENDEKGFRTVFQDIVRDLTDTGEFSDIPDVTEWYTKVLQYNVAGGKLNRGLVLIRSYRAFCTPEKMTLENIRLAYVLGWCIEMLHSSYLILDDVMDEGRIRRGRQCWYHVDGVNNIAINDGFSVMNGLFAIIKKYFSHKPYYLQLLEGFHYTNLKSSVGQSLDMLTCYTFKKHKILNKFTMDRYEAIIKYKTAYYSFYFPVALAMHMTGIHDSERLRQMKCILLQMGMYFQIQDDFLDCFGATTITRKFGTDIQEGKCTWLMVVALRNATNNQKSILEQCYGSKDSKDVETVKQIYQDIGLPSIFADYEENTYRMIVSRIQNLPGDFPHHLFFKILHKIYKRNV